MLHVFMDSFQGCYKDGTEPGTRDCRWFSAVPFIIRITILSSNPNDDHNFGTILLVRPHKQTSLFHIPARTQYLELIWSRACGKCAEL